MVICYDVSTISKEGRRRLRKMAKTFENWGQRVQKSVFECNLSEVHFERLLQTLRKIMAAEEESLRIYRRAVTLPPWTYMDGRWISVTAYGRYLRCAPVMLALSLRSARAFFSFSFPSFISRGGSIPIQERSMDGPGLTGPAEKSFGGCLELEPWGAIVGCWRGIASVRPAVMGRIGGVRGPRIFLRREV